MRKRTSVILVLGIILPLFTLSTVEQTFLDVSGEQESNISIPEFQIFNTTSSVEYFNETSHPRYSLVTKPIGLINYPHKGYPEIINFNDNFTILVNSPSDTSDWNFYLKSAGSTVFLDVLNKRFDNGLWYIVVQPSVNTAGLYDLQLNCSVGSDYQTHSVKILEEKKYPFNFVHLSDTHFPSYDIYNTTDICLRNFAEIKEQNIDFAILTGDLINGPSWMFVDPITQEPLAVEVGLKLALWALDLLDLPVYVIAGNHDLDASTIVPDDPTTIWKKYLGENPVLNYSFLDWLFVGFGSSRDGLNTEEFAYLRSTLSGSSNSPNVLFYHSNYKEQATTLRASYSIEVMLYGHEHHESLSVIDHTLYHCQAPMFYNESTIFTVTNKTHLEMNEIIYDFTILLEETTDTNYTASLLSLSIVISLSYMLKKKKKKKR